MTRKMLALITAMIILCGSFCSALAEEEKKGPFDSIGSFFSDTWKDVSTWAGNAWGDVSSWTANAWGDASAWVGQAWNDTATWATDIWGDVSTWASESYANASESVSTWWTETFSTVTDTSKDVWAWLKESALTLSDNQKVYLERMQTVISSDAEDNGMAVKELFQDLLHEVGITGDDAERIWRTVDAYAESKGLSALTTVKLSLPYLFQLVVDEQSEENRSIPAIAIAQYLTGVIEKLGVTNNDIADSLVVSLNEVLGEI